MCPCFNILTLAVVWVKTCFKLTEPPATSMNSHGNTFLNATDINFAWKNLSHQWSLGSNLWLVLRSALSTSRLHSSTLIALLYLSFIFAFKNRVIVNCDQIMVSISCYLDTEPRGGATAADHCQVLWSIHPHYSHLLVVVIYPACRC